MTEVEWLACTDATPMLKSVRGGASDRKLRLFACAGCRHVWPLLANNECRRGVELAEIFADDDQVKSELTAACDKIWRLSATAQGLVSHPDTRHGASHNAAQYTATGKMWHVEDAAYAVRVLAARSGTGIFQVQILRDIFGNPFRPVALDPHWLTADVVALARGIYDDRAFDRLPILADALIDAGCDNANILGPRRSDGPHVRGCWVVT